MTPASTHYDVVMKCLQGGKHVLVEKPLTVKSAEGQALVDEAKRCGKLLMVGHTFVFNGRVDKMKEIMVAPAFGELYYLHAKRTNLGPIRADTSVVVRVACVCAAARGQSPL